MPGRPPPYLTGPTRRRLTPWLWVILMLVAAGSWYVANREPWIGPIFILAGATIAAQGVDALRTGRLIGRFPNSWPVEAEREGEPISFWALTLVYLATGVGFAVAGAAITFGWLSRSP
jgi:hypothetical protein